MKQTRHIQESGERLTKTFARIYQTEEGIAIDGYDPVAHFVDGQPAKGLPAVETTWMGATWRFTNPTHRELFLHHPEQYAPQYGGYCALGVSGNIIDTSSPTAWEIVDHKLYLNDNRFYRLV